MLDQLVRADVFEQTIHSRYIGTKRYSLEGNTALIPLLDEILNSASENGAEQAVLAMSHRGRLNVIINIVSRPAAEIFAGFEDVDPRSVLGGGDVKYHIGATGIFTGANGGKLRIHLVSNPSHLEAVDPVALGRARAKQTRIGRDGKAKVLPLLMHGDAAFAGQGITAETLNLANLRGYTVGGTVHVIVNNLIGFTTNPSDAYSSRFSSDLAKRLPIPIFHVNGEDPDAVVRVGRMALEYRYEFGTDVVVDLIGFRRHGHSEVDDPTITQPILYRKIKDHPLLYLSYAERIGMDPQPFVEKFQAELDAAQKAGKSMAKKPVMRQLPSYWAPYHGGPYNPADEVDTGLPAAELQRITDGLTSYPADFHIHPKVQKLLEQRREMGYGKRPLDYGMAEALAFGSLALQGTPIRLSGQDSRRGTFNQRHSVLIDIVDEKEYVPLVSSRSRPGTGRDLQLRAVRSRGHGLRVRLLPRLSRGAGHVGGAVRRLRQRRADHHRPVHRRRRRQVGPAHRTGAAAAARPRRPGAGALQRPHRALSCNSAPATTCRSASPRRPRSTSTCCAVRPCASGASH